MLRASIASHAVVAFEKYVLITNSASFHILRLLQRLVGCLLNQGIYRVFCCQVNVVEAYHQEEDVMKG